MRGRHPRLGRDGRLWRGRPLPRGARVPPPAWLDDAYKARLLDDGTAAIAELGFGGPEGEHMVVVENTSAVHNVIVCTLCSCYPWPTLGLPPAWYKEPPYRARMVREPRVLLAEMGRDLPEDVEIRRTRSTETGSRSVRP